MADPTENLLPPGAELALAWSPVRIRPALKLAFELDQRFARIIARTSEPILGQVRLAWWRESLQRASSARPQGDALLHRVSQDWLAGSQPLIGLVDGWERLLSEAPLSEAAVLDFADGRAGALLAACGCDSDEPNFAWARPAAHAWVFADLAPKISDQHERNMVIGLGLALKVPRSRLAGNSRGLAVLGALGRRALEAGAQPLMQGRGAALTAMRAAIFLR